MAPPIQKNSAQKQASTAAQAAAPVLARVLCVDDNLDLTSVMQLIIAAYPDLQCVGCLPSADDLVTHIASLNAVANPAPLIVLLDATMPGKDPLVALRELSKAFPDVRTIVHSGREDAAFIDRATQAGAWGCLSKREEPDAILHAIRRAAAEPRVSPQ